MVLAPLAIIASFVGGGLAYRTGSWTRWPPAMTRQYSTMEVSISPLDYWITRLRG